MQAETSALQVARGNMTVVTYSINCKENPTVRPEKKLRGLSPNFHIHVSVSDLYVPTIGPPMYFPAAEQADRSWEYIMLTGSSLGPAS